MGLSGGHESDLRDMDIAPIRTDADHAAALIEIEALMDARPGTEEGDRLDGLATLVASDEEQRWPIEPPDPIEAVRHALDALGLEDADLQDIMQARRWRVREIMSRRRPLTMSMIRRLHDRLRIPADVLIRPYALEPADRP